jgi:hypothetical protein
MSGNAAHRRSEDAGAPSPDSGLVPSDDARLRRRLVRQIIRRAKAGYSPHEISKMLRLQRCGFWLRPENVTSLLDRWEELKAKDLTVIKRLALVTPATSDPLPDVDQSENLIPCYDSEGVCRMKIAELGRYLRPRRSGTGVEEDPRRWFSRRNPYLVLIRTDNDWFIEIDLDRYVGLIISQSEHQQSKAQKWCHVHGCADDLPDILREVVIEPDPTGTPGGSPAAAGQGAGGPARPEGGNKPPDPALSENETTLPDPLQEPLPKRSPKIRRPKKPAPIKTLSELAAALRDKNNRRRNVPAFLQLIDRLTRENKQPVSIHFDDIRQECHLEKYVDDDSIERRTLIPARKAIVKAGLPYRVQKSGSCAIVRRIPPRPRRRGPA